MTPFQIAIVLAALRIAQEDIDGLNAMPHMEGFDPVTEQDIDELCQEINQ